MKNLFKVVLACLAAAFNPVAQAGTIADGSTAANAYWGSDSHGYGDVVGNSNYYIDNASITRAGSVLTITIATNFAGQAGTSNVDGVGYGDLFLSNVWNPYGTDAHHEYDNASNGTTWKYALRFNDVGSPNATSSRYSSASSGNFTVYQLNGNSNTKDILTTDQVMTCTNCVYRNGQADLVNTKSSTVASTGITGSWKVLTQGSASTVGSIQFQFDMKNSNELMNYTSFAMHWGETCQNDVIEGITSVVPTPGTAPLLALGLFGLAYARRRRA